MTALERRFEAAQALATAAGALAMRMRPVRGGPGGISAGISAGISMKGAQDWLTEADGAVERFLSEQLASAFPEDGFQGEEGGRAREGRLRWVVDPIDGTSNYAHGGARFCVSLAWSRIGRRCSACWWRPRWARRSPHGPAMARP